MKKSLFLLPLFVASFGLAQAALAADPAPPAARIDTYTAQVKAVGEQTIDLALLNIQGVAQVAVDEKTVVVLADGKTGKLSDLKVGQWVKTYDTHPDRANPRHELVVRIEILEKSP